MPSGIEDVSIDIIHERFTRDSLYDIASEVSAVVGVSGHSARRSRSE